MAQIDLLKENGTKLVIVPSMPQSTKRFILRGLPSFANPVMRSVAQLRANIGLGRSAISHRGDYGTVQMPNGTVISKSAFDIGRDLAGKSYGGLSYSERLKQHQMGAERSIDKLEKILAGKSGAGSGRQFFSE